VSAPPDIAALLLGELDPDERLAVAARVGDDPAARAQVERLAPLVACLGALPGDAWQLPEPPPLAFAPLARGQRARPRRSVAAWRSRPLALALAAAALVVVVLGGGIALRASGGSGARMVLEPICSSAHDSGSARLVGSDRLRVDVRGLAPSGARRYYELWLMTDARRLVALGSFPVGRSGSAGVTVPLPVPASRYHYVDVSLQPVGGGPGHSSVSVLRGPTVELARRA
jgi:anti-sigma-K factor RskA